MALSPFRSLANRALRSTLSPAQTLLDVCVSFCGCDANPFTATPGPLPIDTSSSSTSKFSSGTSFASTHVLLLGRLPSSLQFQSHYSLEARSEPLSEFEAVKINVVTGNLRGAGSESAAYIQLVGMDGISPKIPLTDPSGEFEGFERGSTKTFEASVPKGIGPIRRVYVEKEKGRCSEQGEGWYLQHVEIISSSGEKFVFQCNSWLGESDCGGYSGPLARNLLPSAHTTFGLSLDDPEPVSMRISAMAIPHPDKVVSSGVKGVNRVGYGYGGEDAYFYCTGAPYGMGVADGVYAWREHGIDPGQFSKVLMDTCRKMVDVGMEDAFQVLQGASHYVIDEGYMGSAPVCLLTVNPASGLLHAANLGDSGFLIFGEAPGQLDRHVFEPKMELKYRTNQLEYEFGRPYQIGHHENSSKVEDAELACFLVSPGDIIVMGSDGLLDNVSEAEMLTALAKLKAQKATPGKMVQSLVKMAFEASVDKRRVTPYSKGASDFFEMCYAGGKKDDITVLVGLVEPGQHMPDHD